MVWLEVNGFIFDARLSVLGLGFRPGWKHSKQSLHEFIVQES